MSLEKLCKSAKKIDIIDAITGPLSVALYNSGSDVFYTAGVVVSVAEIAFLKLPFIVNYLVQTKDVKTSFFMAAKEAVANVNKVSGLVDVVPFYVMAMNYKMSKVH